MIRTSLILLLLAAGPQEKNLAALKKTLVDTKASAKDREKAAVALAGHGKGGLFLIDLAARGKFPKELEKAVASRIFANPDLGVRGLATQYFKRAGDPDTTIKQVGKLKGDVARGKKVFISQKASCFKCHVFGTKGGDVGPDLTALQTKYDRGEILYNILDPSAAVSFGYESWLIKTKDGEIFSGIMLGDGDEVVLKGSDGKLRYIEADTIAARRQQEKSLMPDNIALGMTPQDLADLLAYLTSDPEEE